MNDYVIPLNEISKIGTVKVYNQAYVDNQQKRIEELELEIKHLTEHLEPQSASALFKQVEEEVRQEQEFKEFKKENTKLKKQIKRMKLDVKKCFGSEYNILVEKLFDKWEIKEK